MILSQIWKLLLPAGPKEKMLLQFVFAVLRELCVSSTVNVEPSLDAELGAGSAKFRKVDSYAQIASFLF